VKLALRLHPDKNSAPGAEDAFKAVGKAFTVLSDEEKRADYDKYGDNAPSENGGTRNHQRYREEDISPEEIFNMFFGGGMHSQRMYRNTRRATPQQPQQPRTPFQQFLQFLPLLLVFSLSLFSFPNEQHVPFR